MEKQKAIEKLQKQISENLERKSRDSYQLSKFSAVWFKHTFIFTLRRRLFSKYKTLEFVALIKSLWCSVKFSASSPATAMAYAVTSVTSVADNSF